MEPLERKKGKNRSSRQPGLGPACTPAGPGRNHRQTENKQRSAGEPAYSPGLGRLARTGPGRLPNAPAWAGRGAWWAGQVPEPAGLIPAWAGQPARGWAGEAPEASGLDPAWGRPGRSV